MGGHDRNLNGFICRLIDFVAGALEKIPGVDGFANDMRRTAAGLRAQVEEAGNLESTLTGIFDSANEAAENRRASAERTPGSR